MIALSNATISFPMFGENFSLNFSRYFTLFGRNFYWYGVVIALGFVLAAVYIMRRRKQFGLTDDNVIDILIWAIVAGVVGARLYYVIFEFDQFRGASFGETLLNIVRIWNGGLAIYGAIIAGMLALVLYCRRKKLSLGNVLDLSSFAVLIGQILGRWGNFFNREAYGAETDLPWKMGLTTEAGTIYVHPTFLYESLWNLIGFLILHFFSKKHRKYDGQIFLMYLTWYGFGRFFIELLRQDSLRIGGENGVRVSCIVAAISVVFGVFMLIRNRNCTKLTPALADGKAEGAADAAGADAVPEAQTENADEAYESDEYEDDEYEDDEYEDDGYEAEAEAPAASDGEKTDQTQE